MITRRLNRSRCSVSTGSLGSCLATSWVKTDRSPQRCDHVSWGGASQAVIFLLMPRCFSIWPKASATGPTVFFAMSFAWLQLESGVTEQYGQDFVSLRG